MSARDNAADTNGPHQAAPYPMDPVTGVLVRAVLPAAGPVRACYSAASGVATMGPGALPPSLPVIAWADCVSRDGQWAGLLPIVPADHATGTIADPRDGFTGIKVR